MSLDLLNVYEFLFGSHSEILGLGIDLIQIALFVNIGAGDKTRVAGGERMVKFAEEVT